MKTKILDNISNNLKNFIKGFILPYKPFKRSVDIWESEFRSGRWNYLEGQHQIARYNLFTGYNDYYFQGNGKILDLGCGQGTLQKLLKYRNFSAYVGVDISQVAIDLATRDIDSKSTFICSAIETYKPEQKFDLIIFNESIYYLENPINILKIYSNYLTADGMIVISMWDYKLRNNKLWKHIDKEFEIIDHVYIYKSLVNTAWNIKLLKRK